MLDENLPRRLFGPEAEATTVGARGWAGKDNGELLRLAETEFDAFVTTDKGIPHQQNVADYDIMLVLLRAKSNSYEDLAPLIDDVISALTSAAPGTVRRVPSQPSCPPPHNASDHPRSGAMLPS